MIAKDYNTCSYALDYCRFSNNLTHFNDLIICKWVTYLGLYLCARQYFGKFQMVFFFFHFTDKIKYTDI